MFLNEPVFKKRIIPLLAAIALGGGLLVVCSGQSASDEPDRGRQASEPNGLHARTDNGGASVFGYDPNSSGGFAYDPDGGIYSNLVRAVLFVVVLAVAAVYASKKLLPKITNLPGKEVRVVETVYLGPRKAVHVLEVGNRRFLVGSTNENITKLADITGDFTGLSEQEVGYN